MPPARARAIADTYGALSRYLASLGMPGQAATAMRNAEAWNARAQDADGSAWLRAAIEHLVADARDAGMSDEAIISGLGETIAALRQGRS